MFVRYILINVIKTARAFSIFITYYSVKQPSMIFTEVNFSGSALCSKQISPLFSMRMTKFQFMSNHKINQSLILAHP